MSLATKRRELALVEAIEQSAIALNDEFKGAAANMEQLAQQAADVCAIMSNWTSVIAIMNSPIDETFIKRSTDA